MPAAPDVEQLRGVAAVRHDLRDVLEVEALVLPGGTVLSFAVGPFHRGRDAGQLLALLRVGRGRERQGELQELHLAGEIRRKLHLVETRGLLGVRHRGRDHPLVGLRRQDLRVVGDERGLDPARASGIGREREKLRLRFVEERLRPGRGRGLTRRRRLLSGLSGHGGKKGGDEEETRQEEGAISSHSSLQASP